MIPFAKRLLLCPGSLRRWLKTLKLRRGASVAWAHKAVHPPEPGNDLGQRAAWKTFLDFGQAVGAFLVGKRGESQPPAGFNRLRSLVQTATRGLNGSTTKSLVVHHLPLAGTCGMVLAAWLLAGCTSPMGADKVKMQQAYAQVDANALRTGKPSAGTVSALHRFDLARLAVRQPEEAVRQLHDKAVATGDRDLLFALAEVSYVAGCRISRSVKPWEPRDARDYYLGSAVYAWLFLFGEGKDVQPSPFDRRFRDACDLYNYGLGLALTERRSTNAVVQLTDGLRRLPVGTLDLRLTPNEHTSRLNEVEQFLLADQFRVRGFSVRNRNAGVGAPLIAVQPPDPVVGTRRALPLTVLLRVQGSLADLDAGGSSGALELYSPFDKDGTTTIGQAEVPLETDLTAYRAYTLNQSRIQKLGKLGFLAPAERFPSQLLLNQPFAPDRIPVVFVHGTFASPVTWAELANSLTADPTLRRRYQIWSFMYGSGNPLVYSMADLRAALTARVEQLDPQGTNVALRQMVVIGHSQGGLLTKATAVDTGDQLWRLFSTNRLENLNLSDAQRTEVRRLLFYQPLPFVKRVVFIATPHRGSYLSGGLARRLARGLVSLPRRVMTRGADVLRLSGGSEIEKFMHGKLPTSLDGMSPKNPGLLAMAEIPVVPEIKAHSIIPVLGRGDYHQGRDGVVAYQSAQVDYAESEFIVRSKHSCLNQPATIEEVKRVLHEHLDGLGGEAKPKSSIE
jgi:pimeloyl-ACP methyl ester carboxylesterase